MPDYSDYEAELHNAKAAGAALDEAVKAITADQQKAQSFSDAAVARAERESEEIAAEIARHLTSARGTVTGLVDPVPIPPRMKASHARPEANRADVDCSMARLRERIAELNALAQDARQPAPPKPAPSPTPILQEPAPLPRSSRPKGLLVAGIVISLIVIITIVVYYLSQ